METAVAARTLAAKWQRETEADLWGRVLPFWLSHSLDGVHGGFYNCLSEDGRVTDPTKHIWLQGRQVWMFARLAATHSEAAATSAAAAPR